MPRLLLVRHGTSSPVGPPRYWGQTDLPLTVEGERQAEALRERLRGERIDVVFASDLTRCLATAQVIAAPRDLPVRPRADLREIAFGECEGLTFAEIDRRFPPAARFWSPEGVDQPFPGGESVNDLAVRVGRFLAECAALEAGATALVVSHGGPLKTLLCQALCLPPRQWWQFRLDLASLSVLDLYHEGVVLGLLNDTSHLIPS